jgi:hypothetical protein
MNDDHKSLIAPYTNKWQFKSSGMWCHIMGQIVLMTQCDIHLFIHSFYFPYIHIQIVYQGCGNCHSFCNNIWQSYNIPQDLNCQQICDKKSQTLY